MSEKRFTVISEKIGRFHNIFVQTDKIEYLLTGDFDNDSEMIKEIVDLLNEQQATITGFQEKIFELRDDKNQLHKVISKLRQEVAVLKTRNSVLSSKLNQIPKSIKEVWLE